MAALLAIVAYRGSVAGVRTNSLDLQVRWFDTTDQNFIRQQIAAEPFSSYTNSDGETVTWELVQIMAIDTFNPHTSGEEVVGFIASKREMIGLYSD
jgi:hypothetical protein